MSWKEFIPGAGDKHTLRKLRELERKAGSLPVLFALFFHETLKSLILNLNLPIPNTISLFITALAIAGLYVYDEQKRKAAKKAKEKAKETKEKAKDAVGSGGQSKLQEFGAEDESQKQV